MDLISRRKHIHMETAKENRLMDSQAMSRAIDKLAFEIAESFPGNELRNMALLGIQHRGVLLAERIYKKLFVLIGNKPNYGTVDISMYRDDIRLKKLLPRIMETRIPFDVNDRNIVLVDDVLSTGRTIRAALDAITDYGRPKTIRLAVLVDRKNHEFPIFADFVGMKYTIRSEERVCVSFKEVDGEDLVYTRPY
jgi:pyrimidine operon attenuation protein/uracil phosphoribosyltransferase